MYDIVLIYTSRKCDLCSYYTRKKVKGEFKGIQLYVWWLRGMRNELDYFINCKTIFSSFFMNRIQLEDIWFIQIVGGVGFGHQLLACKRTKFNLIQSLLSSTSTPFNTVAKSQLRNVSNLMTIPKYPFFFEKCDIVGETVTRNDTPRVTLSVCL